MLNESSYCVVMIIGDNFLIVVYVVCEVEIVDWDVFIFDVFDDYLNGNVLVWKSVDDKISIFVDLLKFFDFKILKENDICVIGYVFV